MRRALPLPLAPRLGGAPAARRACTSSLTSFFPLRLHLPHKKECMPKAHARGAFHGVLVNDGKHEWALSCTLLIDRRARFGREKRYLRGGKIKMTR